MLEAHATLGYLAGQTHRVRLGTMVTGVTFRPAALLIKAVTTLDLLSRGRAWLGVGAGYHSAESDLMGLPLPPQRERFELLADTLELAMRMWSGGRGQFAGMRLHLAGPVGSPRPVSRPRPHVLVGGMGEKQTLRLVAEHADACNLFDVPDGGVTVRRRLEVLRQHCSAIGRPYHEFDKTISTRFDPAEPTADFVDRCRLLGEAGISHIVCITTGPWTAASIGRLATAVPALADLPTASGSADPPARGRTD